MTYLKARIYVKKSASTGLSTSTKVAIGVGTTVAVAAGAVMAAPLVLAGVGFSTTGVVGGTLAATWQSVIGNVVRGTLFAGLQSAGTKGLGLAALSAAGAAGAAAGGLAGGIIASGVKKDIPVVNLQKTFDIYDLDQDGYVSSSFLRNILNDLEVNMSDEELKQKFKNATGCEFNTSTPISYEEFLSLFGLEIYKDENLGKILGNVFGQIVKKKGKLVPNDVKKMLQKLNVNASEKHIEACFESVLSGQSDNILNLEQFLKLFGITFDDNN